MIGAFHSLEEILVFSPVELTLIYYLLIVQLFLNFTMP